MIIEEKFPKFSDDPLAAVILVILTSPDVHDCVSILSCVLAAAASPHTEINILETLYLLLGLLVSLRTRYSLPARPVYILQHALQLHHNPRAAVTASCRLTSEQRRIVNMDLASLLGTSHTVRINAYAGTGKTTTLLELCRNNPNIRFHLVVFNKSVAEESKAKFPRNVRVSTANSLSWKYITKTEGKSNFNHWGLKYQDINNNYILKSSTRSNVLKKTPFTWFHYVPMALATFTSYCNSGDESINFSNTPKNWRARGELQSVDDSIRSALVEDATTIWDCIVNKKHSKMKFDHCSSMKKFQLSAPDLQEWAGPHDVLLLDEAQDMNPCMLAVCLQQKVPKIVVGDSFQQIYSFRGAVDALKRVSDSNLTCVKDTFYLTQSFRFGPEIAFAADCCLKYTLHNKGPSVFGVKKRDSILGGTSLGLSSQCEQVSILGRTNSRLFEEMVTLVCEVEEHRRPKIAFPPAIGTEAMGFEKIRDLYYFNIGETNLISKWNPIYKKSWKDFVAQTEAANDNELIGKINIIEKYGDKLPGYLDILNHQLSNMNDPGVKYVFSTVHKFKGLESDHVRLLDDFFYNGVPYTAVDPSNLEEKDELNLLYVALTRAKKVLTINPALYFLLTSTTVDECFQRLVLSPEGHLDCVRCGEMAPSQSRVCYLQDRVRVGDSLSRKAGMVCAKCASLTVRRINHRLSEKTTKGYKVGPGVVHDRYQTFLRTVLHPGPNVLDAETLEAHESLVMNLTDVNQVVKEEDVIEEDVDNWGDDDDSWLKTVEEEGEIINVSDGQSSFDADSDESDGDEDESEDDDDDESEDESDDEGCE